VEILYLKKKIEDKKNFEEAVAKCEEHKNIIYKLNLTSPFNKGIYE